MTLRFIHELLEKEMLFCPTHDSHVHLVRVMQHAATCGRLDRLNERLSYLCPREDETIVIVRDGMPQEMSFFWRQITRAQHDEAKARLMDDGGKYRDYTAFMPSKTYHGGLIYRGGYDPIDWGIHT